ncbi:NlpC/P60 family protein [Clostridium sp. DL1XJH146]
MIDIKYALVNKAIASLRGKETRESELLDEAIYGMKVEILEESDLNWYKIKTHYRYTGYVHSSDLILDEDKIKFWEKGDKKVILHGYADILSLPKVQGICLISLTKGAIVVVLEKADQNGWVKVLLCDGREGYIKDKFIVNYINEWDITQEGKLRKDIVDAALSYMGTQYRWGGKTTLGIDCSGLCSMAYMLNGIDIYRDASIVEGFPIHEIEFENIKPADLLFYKGHVAMYIGNDKIVHSTGKNGSDGVVINSLNPADSDYREDLPQIFKAAGSLF